MDQLRKTLTKDGQAIAVTVDATGVAREAMSRLGAWPPSMLHLGQAMMAGLLLQALPDREIDERIELQWRCSGPFGHLFAECRGAGRVRGTIQEAQPQVLSMVEKLGPGILQVRRSPKSHLPASMGLVEAEGDVALDVLSYLERSEQKNCAMNLWVEMRPGPGDSIQIEKALGYLVHVLPKQTEAKTNEMLYHWDCHLRALGPLHRWVLGKDPCGEILSIISGEFTPQILLQKTVESFCTCGQERAAQALALADALAPLPEIADAAQSKEGTPVRCEFCGRTYLVNPTPIEK